MAGLHVRTDYDRFAAVARDLLPSSRVRIYNDGEVALAAATGGSEGIVVVAGTGSIAFGADRFGHHMRCGGWGYILGDEGSAYAIVVAAFRAASFANDGRAPASTLVPAFCQALGVPTFDDMLRPVYGPPAMTRHEIAAFAPLVANCAAEGDAAARAVLTAAGADLATMPIALARRLEFGASAFPVACSGGVWKAGELVLGPSAGGFSRTGPAQSYASHCSPLPPALPFWLWSCSSMVLLTRPWWTICAIPMRIGRDVDPGGALWPILPSLVNAERRDEHSIRCRSRHTGLTALCPHRSRVGPPFHGLCAARGAPGKPPWERAWGSLDAEADAEPAMRDSIFDLASLTKVFVATACLSLVGHGVLSLDDEVRRVIPEFTHHRRDAVTFRHLLAHTSGLPAHLHLYRHCHGPDEVLGAICTVSLATRPGERVEYSCLGFVLLGEALCRLAGARLDGLLMESVTVPLGIAGEVMYLPAGHSTRRIAATERCAWRGRRLRGEVHDENAAAMGGVSGNAGLFGTARAVAALGRLYLDCGVARDAEVLRSHLAAEAVCEQAATRGERRGLGWALKNTTAPQTSAGSVLSPVTATPASQGRDLGYPTRGLVVALLTNRVYYGREATDLLAFRAAIHDTVARGDF